MKIQVQKDDSVNYSNIDKHTAYVGGMQILVGPLR